jgi:hypothetical protein
MTKPKPLEDYRQHWVEWYQGVRKGPPPKPDFPGPITGFEEGE